MLNHDYIYAYFTHTITQALPNSETKIILIISNLYDVLDMCIEHPNLKEDLMYVYTVKHNRTKR